VFISPPAGAKIEGYWSWWQWIPGADWRHPLGPDSKIEGMDDQGNGITMVHAKVPLSELFGYTTILRSMTQGRGSATIEPDHYEIVPKNVEEEIRGGRK
jgi:hypothetical protein